MTTPGTDLVVLDTSVVSLLLHSVAPAVYYQGEIAGRRAVISFQTQEEAWFGAIKAGWGPRTINQLRRHLDQYQMIGVTPELIDICAHLRSERESVGRHLKTALFVFPRQDHLERSVALKLEMPIRRYPWLKAAVPYRRPLGRPETYPARQQQVRHHHTMSQSTFGGMNLA